MFFFLSVFLHAKQMIPKMRTTAFSETVKRASKLLFKSIHPKLSAASCGIILQRLTTKSNTTNPRLCFTGYGYPTCQWTPARINTWFCQKWQKLLSLCTSHFFRISLCSVIKSTTKLSQTCTQYLRVNNWKLNFAVNYCFKSPSDGSCTQHIVNLYHLCFVLLTLLHRFWIWFC